MPDSWKQAERPENPAAKVEFTRKTGEAGALVIVERLQMPISALRKAVIEKSTKLDKDAKLVCDETRIVNGTEVLCLTTNAKVEGIPVTYHGFYYASGRGRSRS